MLWLLASQNEQISWRNCSMKFLILALQVLWVVWWRDSAQIFRVQTSAACGPVCGSQSQKCSRCNGFDRSTCQRRWQVWFRRRSLVFGLQAFQLSLSRCCKQKPTCTQQTLRETCPFIRLETTQTTAVDTSARFFFCIFKLGRHFLRFFNTSQTKMTINWQRNEKNAIEWHCRCKSKITTWMTKKQNMTTYFLFSSACRPKIFLKLT